MFKKVLTSPQEHNPNDFIYLVHGLIDYSGNRITPEDVSYKLERIRNHGEFYRASMVGHMDEESAKKRVGWHGNELYRMFTFGNVGLIINPTSNEDIKIAWYCGLGSPNEPDEQGVFYRDNYQASEKAKMVSGVVSGIMKSNVPIIELPNSRILCLPRALARELARRDKKNL